ncbi:MAG: chromosomal replication initiator protein DnaA [Sedimentisphaerales bacterium]|nr:chromosomal replication initiator protein DnaA [Sedimentisphaerales bacterium]
MTTISERAWSDILASLKADHPELVRPWFAALQPLDMQHGIIRVDTSTPDQYHYLIHDCQLAFNAAAQSVTSRLVTVHFLPPAAPFPGTEPLAFERETENVVLNDNYTFENFVAGPCNRLAHAACVAVAENPGRVYNPLYVHGSVGLGKTHLLQAVCHEIRARRPDTKILYLSCETFTNHFVEAIERGALHQFRYRYRHVDVLVIDDIQFLGARERSREEFFHTFNTLFQSQKQIILSADESPRDIPSLEDRLISRFNWGLVTRLEAPCLETRMAIVCRKAKLRCAEIPEDVIHFIAASVDSSIRELEGALTRVLAVAQQYGGTVDLAVAREALAHNLPARNHRVTISDILQTVTERYDVRLTDLQGKRRHRSLAFPRQVCMYLARELTPLSLEEIGGHFGGRDHTTVLHAIRTISQQRTIDKELEANIRQITEFLRKQSA